MKNSRVAGCLALPEAVNILAMYSIVMSLFGAVAAGCLFPFPSILECGVRNCEYKTSLPMIYSLAVFVILVNIGWFTFSSYIYEKNKIHGIKGVKKIIKIGCYVIASILSLKCAISLLFGLVTLVNQEQWNMVGFIVIPLGLICILFTYICLHGIRTESPGKIKAWLIFEFVIF